MPTPIEPNRKYLSTQEVRELRLRLAVIAHCKMIRAAIESLEREDLVGAVGLLNATVDEFYLAFERFDSEGTQSKAGPDAP